MNGWNRPADKMPADNQECLLMPRVPDGTDIVTVPVFGPIMWSERQKMWLDLFSSPEAGTMVTVDKVGLWRDWASIAPAAEDQTAREVLAALGDMVRLYESKWSDEPDELKRARAAIAGAQPAASRSPKDKLIHDMFVWLCDAAQRLLNSADWKEPVSKESADQVKAGCSALSDRWAELLVTDAVSAPDRQPSAIPPGADMMFDPAMLDETVREPQPADAMHRLPDVGKPTGEPQPQPGSEEYEAYIRSQRV